MHGVIRVQAAAVFVLMVASGGALAFDAGIECENYADDAVWQAQQLYALRCGDVGDSDPDVWTGNWFHHRTLCERYFGGTDGPSPYDMARYREQWLGWCVQNRHCPAYTVVAPRAVGRFGFTTYPLVCESDPGTISDCPRQPTLSAFLRGQRHEIVVRPYPGVGIKCLTRDQAAAAGNDPAVTHFKNLGDECTICPEGYIPRVYRGMDACVRCPEGTQYLDGCCR